MRPHVQNVKYVHYQCTALLVRLQKAVDEAMWERTYKNKNSKPFIR